jgi:hypothetical protein
MRNADIALAFNLTHEEAAALAAFFRRAGYLEFRECAEGQPEAYLMLIAAAELREALSSAGYT